MSEVMTPIAHSLMNTRKNFVGFLSHRASVLGLGLLSACFRKSGFFCTKKARVLEEGTIRQSREGFQPNVYANAFFGDGQCERFHRAGDAGKPFPVDATKAAGFGRSK